MTCAISGLKKVYEALHVQKCASLQVAIMVQLCVKLESPENFEIISIKS